MFETKRILLELDQQKWLVGLSVSSPVFVFELSMCGDDDDDEDDDGWDDDLTRRLEKGHGRK